MIKTPKLNDYSFYFSDQRGTRSWWFCTGGVRELFNVPIDAKQIQFVFAREPSSESYPFRYEAKSYGGEDCLAHVGSTKVTLSGQTVPKLRKLDKRRTGWHVSLYYWK